VVYVGANPLNVAVMYGLGRNICSVQDTTVYGIVTLFIVVYGTPELSVLGKLPRASYSKNTSKSPV
jgi:hypothetical protein